MMLQVMLWRTYSISIYHFIGTKGVFLQGWRGCCQCFDACLWVKASPPVIHRCVWMSNLCSKHLPSVSALEDCRLFGDSDKTPVGTGTGRVWGMQPQFGKCCLPTCWSCRKGCTCSGRSPTWWQNTGRSSSWWTCKTPPAQLTSHY